MVKVGVIGAGAWGTALAMTAAKAGQEVWLQAREPDVVADINQRHENPFLPGACLPEMIHATQQISDVISWAEVVLLVAPAQFTRTVLQSMAPLWRAEIPLVLCAKGIELTTGLLLTEVASEVLPKARLAVLSGPGFAAEVARECPTAVTIASPETDLASSLCRSLQTPYFRPYSSTDMMTPEVCGALKNVFAIAAGMIDGCALGDNARAAMLTRGLAEMARFATALGGHRSGVLGLAGVGDLMLTAGSRQSRNYSFGFEIGKTGKAQAVIDALDKTVEGLPTTEAVMSRAQKMGIDMPLVSAIEQVLYHQADIAAMQKALLARPLKAENL